jgi:hypothetical protein
MLNKIAFVPGIDKQNSEYGAEGRWIDSDYVRFRYGLPEKMGGWESVTPDKLVGLSGSMLAWNSLDGTPHVAFATNRKLYIWVNDELSDITPLRLTVTSKTITPTASSNILTVSHTAHGAGPGDIVTLSAISGAVGGLANPSVLAGQYQITTVIDANSYTLSTGQTFSNTTAGTATVAYDIGTFGPIGFINFGWGTGAWGAEAWGTPRSPSLANGVLLNPGLWTLDTYGENLIATYVNGDVYEWSPSSGVGVKATPVANAPTVNTLAVVSEYRYLVLCGTEEIIGDQTSFDPMLVRFSSQEDINDWEPTATNTAGLQRLTDGSEIVAAARSRQQILIWTDTALHGMQYVGAPYSFGFSQLGSNCGAVGPKSIVDVNGVAYWMGRGSFFVYDGTVKKMACTVQDFVFQDINYAQHFLVECAVNSNFNEVTWFYASSESSYVDRFVAYNYLENVWTTGTMARTAWQDQGVLETPVACEYSATTNSGTTPVVYGLVDGSSSIYAQEVGVDADGQPIASYITSGYFDIGDGDQVMFVKRLIPDFKYQTGDIVFNVLTRNYPSSNAEPSSRDPYLVTPTTEKVDTRIRGRQVSIGLENDSLGGNWRFGTLRVDLQPDGLR